MDIRNGGRHQGQSSVGLADSERNAGQRLGITLGVKGYRPFAVSLAQPHIGHRYSKYPGLDSFRSLDDRRKGVSGGSRSGETVAIDGVVQDNDGLRGKRSELAMMSV